MKNKIVFLIYLIILIVIFLVIVFYIIRGIQIVRLNNMIKDIEILEDKIELYYLDNGNIPIKSNSIDFKVNSINPNDNSNYYEIDLSKLKNLDITYGKEQKGENDKYIINEQSHMIYYYQGLEVNGRKVYTKESDYSLVNLENYR